MYLFIIIDTVLALIFLSGIGTEKITWDSFHGTEQTWSFPPEYCARQYAMHLQAYCVRIMRKLLILFMNTNIIVIEISLPLTHSVSLCTVAVCDANQRVYHATHIIV